jgi:very-short-patch-repair endonuclease
LWQVTGELIDKPEITVPRGRKRTSDDNIVHRCDLDPSEITVVDAIPVTTPARTMIDLAGLVSRETLEEALDEAIRRNRKSPAQLRWVLSRTSLRGRRGIGTLRTLLDARRRSADVPASPLETKLLHAMMRAGLPKPELQHEVRDSRSLVAVVDFAFPALKIAIEADGYRWHSGRVRWQRDLSRRNKLTALGWRVIHVTWSDLEANADQIVESVRRVMTSPR